MMVCKRCGTEFSDGFFCPECGMKMATEYDREKYGPQGELEEQKIAKQIRLAGIKMVFENKVLIFGQNIVVEDNVYLEFKNCKFVISECEAIQITGENISIDFRNCCFEGKESVVVGNCIKSNHIKLVFQNSAFIAGGSGKAEEFFSLKMCGNILFENCFINRQKICKLAGEKWKSELEFQKCIIIDGNACVPQNYADSLIFAKNAVVKFNNCFIRSFRKLVDDGSGSSNIHSNPGSNIYSNVFRAVALTRMTENAISESSASIKLLVKNTYLDSYSYFSKCEETI